MYSNFQRLDAVNVRQRYLDLKFRLMNSGFFFFFLIFGFKIFFFEGVI